MAFRDIHPQAPIHILVIPQIHIESLAETSEKDGLLLGHMLNVVRTLAQNEGLDKNGYRVVVNTGNQGGQTVNHIHFHLLGGRFLQWPPG